MGKRYYCDYCERTFPDSADNRKKHINGVQHQRQLKLHYDTFRDAETILTEELSKKPCKRYRQSGNCDYGPACRFSHLTPEDMYRLKHRSKLDRLEKRKKESFAPPIDHNALNSFLAKVAKREKAEPGAKEQNPLEDALNVHSWKMPPELQHHSQLPPSLVPPTLKDILKFGTLSTWG